MATASTRPDPQSIRPHVNPQEVTTRYIYWVPEGRGFGRWIRYDFLALSLMIRGVLSPGSEARVDC